MTSIPKNIVFGPGESEAERGRKYDLLFSAFEKGGTATLYVDQERKAENISSIGDAMPHIGPDGFKKKTIEFRFGT